MRLTGLLVLGLICSVVGVLGTIALVGAPRLDGVADGLRQLLGWSALPVLVGLAVAGMALVARRDDSPWRLPWGRAVGAELAVLSALVLVTHALGDAAPVAEAREVAPAGLAGWALATATAEAIGHLGSVVLWLAVGLAGLLVASDVGGGRLASGLDHAAEWLAKGARDPVDEERTDVAGEPHRPAVSDRAGRSDRAGGSDRPGVSDVAATGSATRQELAARADAGVASGGSPDRAKPTEPERRRASPDSPRLRAPHLPPLDILGDDPVEDLSDATLEALGATIERCLASFGVPVDVVDIERGPSVTRFGVAPGLQETSHGERRVKVSRITALKHDLALALAAPTIRIEAPIPGRNLVGIEVPSAKLGLVGLKGLLSDPAFAKVSRERGLAVALGRDVTGAPVVGDLGAMPHLLVAGATGSGKSVCVDALLASLLFQNTPDTLRLVLVDPKRVELSRYAKLPHLVSSVVTDVEEVVGALRWVVDEMDRRYKLFAERGVRDLTSHNDRSPAGEAPLPVLAIVIDELADLMLTAPTETEPLLTRIAQLGRATGIHLVVATQRPSTDVVTGLIKANFPSRIAFAVSSGVDSRVILDRSGAESLLGRGDMLYQAADAMGVVRAQGALVSDAEIDALVRFWRESHWDEPGRVPPWDDLIAPLDPNEALLDAVRHLAREHPGELTPSLIQRKLRVGYGKARELHEQHSRDWPEPGDHPDAMLE
ncbi:MAG: DNA translocase FtsK 4TM domain-containing protein [Anaerolineae bacterium]